MSASMWNSARAARGCCSWRRAVAAAVLAAPAAGARAGRGGVPRLSRPRRTRGPRGREAPRARRRRPGASRPRRTASSAAGSATRTSPRSPTGSARGRLRPALPRTQQAAAGSTRHEGLYWEYAASATAARGRARSPASSATRRPSAQEAAGATSPRRRAAAPPATAAAPRVLAWFSDRHSLALAGGNRSAPSCPDCHSSHRVRPASAPESAVNRSASPRPARSGALGRGAPGRLPRRPSSAAAVAGAAMNPLPGRREGRGGPGSRSVCSPASACRLVVRAGIGLARGR